jgi:hypothetical protein
MVCTYAHRTVVLTVHSTVCTEMGRLIRSYGKNRIFFFDDGAQSLTHTAVLLTLSINTSTDDYFKNKKRLFKGTVARDYRPLVFFNNRPPMGP